MHQLCGELGGLAQNHKSGMEKRRTERSSHDRLGGKEIGGHLHCVDDSLYFFGAEIGFAPI